MHARTLPPLLNNPQHRLRLTSSLRASSGVPLAACALATAPATEAASPLGCSLCSRSSSTGDSRAETVRQRQPCLRLACSEEETGQQPVRHAAAEHTHSRKQLAPTAALPQPKPLPSIQDVHLQHRGRQRHSHLQLRMQVSRQVVGGGAKQLQRGRRAAFQLANGMRRLPHTLINCMRG